MSELGRLSDAELQTLRTSCQDVLRAVVGSLEDRADMQAAIQQVMNSDNAFEALASIPDDDLKRLTLQACVAALVNLQSMTAIDAEIERRAGLN